MTYRKTPKVHRDGEVYWHIEKLTRQRWETVIPYLSVEEANELLSNPVKIKSIETLYKVFIGVLVTVVATIVFLAFYLT